MKDHFHTHRFKYLSFTIVAVIAYMVFKAQADTSPTFIKDITYTGGVAATTPPSFYGTATGLVTDSAGNVYFSAGTSITEVSPTGAPLARIDGLASPQGLAIDSLGNIYVADYGVGVKKFDPNGNLLNTTSDSFSNGVAVDASGTIYLAISQSAPLARYDSSFNSLSALTLSDPLSTWHPGITSDAAGYIYIADFNANKVKKIDSGGSVLLSFGTTGSSTGQFSGLSGIALDTTGNIYVTDQVNGGRLQKFDASGNFLSSFPLHVAGYPIGISVDPSNNIWISEGDAVEKYDQSGNVLVSLVSGTGPLVDAYTFHPWKVTTDAQGNIYATDDWNFEVLKFNAQGDFLMRIGTPDQYDWNNDVAVDAAGNIYVSDCGNGVKKFAPNGTLLSQIGTGGTGDGQFTCANSLTLDSVGNLYVEDDDYNNNIERIEKFDADGNFLVKFGSAGSGDGQFGYVDGMHVDAAGNIYITDTTNDRIQKLDSNGNFIMKFGSTGTSAGQFQFPEGIDVDTLGNIYVAEWGNNRLQKFDSNGNYLLSITSADGIPFNHATGVHIDSSGKLYLGDYTNGRISVFSVVAPPLSLSGIQATPSATSTLVSWTSSDPSTSQVEFGPSINYSSSSAISDTSSMVTSHSVVLSNLVSCATYNYRVRSSSGSATTTSSNLTFTTDSCTGSASSTASVATTASTTATSTLTIASITLSIPSAFSTTTQATTTFQAVKLEATAFFASSSIPAGTKSASMDVFHLNALTDATTSITSFTAPITVTLSYSPSQLAGINEATLKIYRFDAGSWSALSPCTRDPNAHTVTCTTTHFSDFALFGEAPTPSSSSVTLGGGYFISAPVTSPSSGGSVLVPSSSSTGMGTSTFQPTDPTLTLTAPAPKPVITPIKITSKPVVKAISNPKASSTILTSPRVRPRGTTTPRTLSTFPTFTATATPPVVTPAPKSFWQMILDHIKSSQNDFICMWKGC